MATSNAGYDGIDSMNPIELSGAPMAAKLTDVQLGLKEADMPAAILDQLQQLEAKGIKAAEEKDYKTAVQFFTDAITLRPTYLSAYNNRAYTYQLSGQRDLAMADLQAAIALPPTDKNALKQIYTQRGMLRRLADDDEGALGMYTHSRLSMSYPHVLLLIGVCHG